MAESSPLEAAAKPILRALYGVRWDEATDLQQLTAKELARAAIAAYEAEQPAPDRDEPNVEAVAAALMNRGWMAPNAVAGWFPNNPDWIKMAKAGAQANLDSVAEALRVAGVGGVPAEPQPQPCRKCQGADFACPRCNGSGIDPDPVGAVPQDRETGQ